MGSTTLSKRDRYELQLADQSCNVYSRNFELGPEQCPQLKMGNVM